MIPRQTTLCVPHFIKYAIEEYELDEDIKSKSDSANSGKTEALTTGCWATRVQPRRAAKAKCQTYAESSGSEDDDKDDNDDEHAEQLQNTRRKKEDTAESRVRSKMEPVMKQLSGGAMSCIFGPKPWTCEMCRQGTAAAKKAPVRKKKTDPDPRRPVAEMEPGMNPDTEGQVLPDWSDCVVPPSRIFQIGEHLFTVDACHEQMVLRLR